MSTQNESRWDGLRAVWRELIWLCPAAAVAALALCLASCGSGMADLAVSPAHGDEVLPAPLREPLADTRCSPLQRACLA